jgi:hypothetical protein
VIRLRSAVFNQANDTITLTPKKAFALTKPVELTINGTPPSGLQDTSGQLIDGEGNGTPGGNAVALIRRTGVTMNPVVRTPATVSHPTHRTPSGGRMPVIVLGPPVITPPSPAPPVVSGPTSPGSPVMPSPMPAPSPTPTPVLPPPPPVMAPTPAPPSGGFPIY